MKPRLAVTAALVAAWSIAPRAGAEGPAYASLAGLAAASDEDRVREGRMPEGVLARREAPGAPSRAASPLAGGTEEAAEREAALVVAPAPRAASAWTRLFVLLLPPASAGVPQLRASTAAYAGGRPIRSRMPAYVPRETEEGVRRGMAEMLAVMSAGADPLPAGRR